MNVVLAIDSFKGSLSSVEAGEACARGIRRAIPKATCVVRPLADGGEGTVEALVAGCGGARHRVRVTGPLGAPVEAEYGLLPNGVAVMEMASAAGLPLIAASARNPLVTATFGVGEMILDAVRRGARRFVIGIGGSATNDGGAGLLQALGWQLLDEAGRALPPGGGALGRLARIIPPPEACLRELKDLAFRIACDVTNPLCGPNGASAVFGPQKGATPEMVAQLDEALARLARLAGGDPAIPGSGAAGGLGFAFRTFLNAELVRGVDLILDETHLEEAIRAADLVVTGEGRLDGQTAMGKAPIGVARLAARCGRRTIAFAGALGEGVEALNAAGIDAYFPILRRITTLDAALEPKIAADNLESTAEQVFRLLRAAARPN